MTINECEKVLSSIKNDKLNIRHKSTGYGIVEIAEWLINELKAADQSLKHGRWIPQGDDMWLCSNCKENIIYSEHESDRTEKQRYCCRCGARMDGDTE